jgi:hypothetical protein
MRRSTPAILALDLTVVPLTLFAKEVSAGTGEETAIRAIESLFTADAYQLVSDGTWRRGRDELVRGMFESSRRNPAKREARTARCG